MESFWATMNNKPINEQAYATRTEAKSAIFRSIEIVHNCVRLHGALDSYPSVDLDHNLN